MKTSTLFALVDCDHFYASCERVFRPDLWKRPVAVLSNNDGCVIARSPEVKALGIKMGTPFFQCKTLLRSNHAEVFSANFPLYGDLSHRVMNTLRYSLNDRQDLTQAQVEVYSIDEAFIELTITANTDLEALVRELRAHIFQHVGIPVSIGISTTKTLAKAATYFAKRNPSRVAFILNEYDRVCALRQMPIDDVWGIGHRWAKRLKQAGMTTALELADVTTRRLKHIAHNINLTRSVYELRGQSCIALDLAPPPRRSMRYSRTFSQRIHQRSTLDDAISDFAGRIANQLRNYQRKAGSLSLWLSAPIPTQAGQRTTRRPHHYVLRQSLSFLQPCSDTPTLIRAGQSLLSSSLEQAYQEAPHCLSRPIGWRKAGITALDLRDDLQGILNLAPPNPRRVLLSELEDQLNQRFGLGTARIGGIPFKRHVDHHRHQRSSAEAWRPKALMLSPRYTTCWADLPMIDS